MTPGDPRLSPRWLPRWSKLLWALVYPRGGARISATPSGAVLIALSMGVGMAAYNAANNILFITLSLLLACLVLSGMMSWLNFRGVTWRLLLAPPLRAGHDTLVSLDLANAKGLLPSYGLWFDLVAQAPAAAAAPEASAASSGSQVKGAFASLEARESRRTRGRLFLKTRLGPQEGARLDWVFRPSARGVHHIALEGVGSLFPFGFLRKSLPGTLRREVIVWPAPVDYRWTGVLSSRPRPAGKRTSRAGSGSDLFALRRYEHGDSHRLIHWKASARQQQLLVRQFSAESQQAYALWVTTPADVWTRPGQFELMIGFAASLAEDLFRMGRLRSVAVNDAPPRPVGRVRDLEAFLDELAIVGLVKDGPSSPATPAPGAGRKNLLTFAPDGSRGVSAHVDGGTAATA